MSKTGSRGSKNYRLKSLGFGVSFTESEETLREKYRLSTVVNEESVVFRRIGRKFTTLLQMLWKYMNSIGSVAEATTAINFYSLPIFIGELVDRELSSEKDQSSIAIVEFKLTFENKVNGQTKNEKIKCKIYDIAQLKRLLDYKDFSNTALRILHETTIQQIVNSYEQLLGGIISWQLNSNPEAAPKDEEITYRELLTFSSLEEAKKHVIESHITTFLKNKNTDDQIKYLRDELKADISSYFPRLPELKELILRRHAIVHAGGIATSEYIRKVKKINGYDSSKINAGDVLELTTSYVKNAWEITYSFGVILIHLLARQYAQSINNKIIEKEADSFLIDSSYVCIQEEQYSTAETILRYASKLRLSEQPVNWIVDINLAQVLLWQGKHKECNQILDSSHWNSTSLRFQLCVHALKNDSAKFQELLSLAVARNEITINELLEWPIFRFMRECDDFPKWLENAFGKQHIGISQSFSPKLLNFQYETTREEIDAYFKRINKKKKPRIANTGKNAKSVN